MIYQKQSDGTLEPFPRKGGKITNGTDIVSISLATAHIWAEKDIVRLNTWNLFKPAEVDSKPNPFDPAAELLVGPSIVVTETTITRTWTKIAKTVEQRAAEKIALSEEISRIVFIVLHNHENRVRALERLAGQNKPAITKAEMKNILVNLLP